MWDEEAGALRPIDFRIDLFRSEGDRVNSEKVMMALLAGLCLQNIFFLQGHPGAPSIYRAGVRYQKEPPGQEEWQDIPNMLRTGNGDCEDLACWRVAELRVRHGVKAKPRLTYKKAGAMFRYHVTVQYPDGRVEDPSRKLGMGAP